MEPQVESTIDEEYETRINLGEPSPLTPTEIEEVAKKCSDIKRGDPTFLYSLKDRGEGWIMLVIFSQSKNVAYKRGSWLVNKMDELKEHRKKYSVKVHTQLTSQSDDGRGAPPNLSKPPVSLAPRPDILERLD